jgi:hypothetical protein
MGDEIQRFANLLTSARPILTKMDDADRLRPPTFNIFEVLGLAHSEVRTHSALLAYLLNPSEGHNQGTVFLKAFVELLREREKPLAAPSVLPENTTREWSCHPELYLKSWGLADIVIRAPNSLILIENKIYAGDQHRQLYRYWQYALEQKVPYLLVYLTPHGTSPSPYSLSGEQGTVPEKHLILLSYRTHIRPWIQSMAAKVSAVSISEVLWQYANLVERL